MCWLLWTFWRKLTPRCSCGTGCSSSCSGRNASDAIVAVAAACMDAAALLRLQQHRLHRASDAGLCAGYRSARAHAEVVVEAAKFQAPQWSRPHMAAWT
mmetsp:Transcript_34947/g.96594  ORF Transcript_34947/g.96594 Transcript_34947/m.96594 type:complete len:99 (-) Transcript_34947:28-324(-)